MGTALKALLHERHLHAYSDFVAEYHRRAQELDLTRHASPPTKAQYYRWLAGDLQNLPRGHHCAVLEQMFPGWTAKELFVGAPNSPSTTSHDDGELLSSVVPVLEPALLAGLWVTAYVMGDGRRHVDLSTVTASRSGVTSRNYPPEPRAEGHHTGHIADISARLFGRHVMGQWRNRNDRYYYGSLHLAVLPGEAMLDGYYTGFLNDTQIVAEPWRWVRVAPVSVAGVDLSSATLGQPREIYDMLAQRSQFDGPISLEQVTEPR